MEVHASRVVEYLQKISRAGQVGIKANEHASGDRPDRTFNDTGEILDDSSQSIRQYRIAVNCLMTKANSPGTIMNDVPSRERCAKPLNLDPAGGMCKISLEVLRCHIAMRQDRSTESRRQAL